MHQPWASLLVHGIKRVDGRSWPSHVTGRLWIHAASKVPDHDTVAAMEDFYREIHAVDGVDHIDFPQHYPVSRLLGCIDVVGCVRSEELVCWEDVPQSPHGCQRPPSLIESAIGSSEHLPLCCINYRGILNKNNCWIPLQAWAKRERCFTGSIFSLKLVWQGNHGSPYMTDRGLIKYPKIDGFQWKGVRKGFIPVDRVAIEQKRLSKDKTVEEHKKMLEGIVKRDEKRRKRIKAAGIDYECPTLVANVPPAHARAPPGLLRNTLLPTTATEFVRGSAVRAFFFLRSVQFLNPTESVQRITPAAFPMNWLGP